METYIIPSIISFITGLCTTLIVTALYNWNRKRAEYKSKLTRTWSQSVYEHYPTNIRAKDIVKCKHNKKTDQVSGEISRVFPDTEKHKKWKFSGRFNENTIYLTFWPVADKTPSFGTIIMNFDVEKNKFLGGYTKPDSVMEIDTVVKMLVKTNVVWEEILEEK